MTEEILDNIIDKMSEDSASKAYDYSDQLVRIGGEDVLNKMIGLLQSPSTDVQYLASRTLGLMGDHEAALLPLFDAIFNVHNKLIQGMLAEYLDEYDCSQYFVKVFKLFLFGSVKASAMAKEVLDYEEFDITPRVIRKAEKQWSHYIKNVKHDEAFDLMKKETEEFLGELKALFEEE